MQVWKSKYEWKKKRETPINVFKLVNVKFGSLNLNKKNSISENENHKITYGTFSYEEKTYNAAHCKCVDDIMLSKMVIAMISLQFFSILDFTFNLQVFKHHKDTFVQYMYECGDYTPPTTQMKSRLNGIHFSLLKITFTRKIFMIWMKIPNSPIFY